MKSSNIQKEQKSQIHPTAVVDPKAQIGQGTIIGPYAIIGPDVKMGNRCQIGAHTVIDGICTLGDQVKILQFAAIGGPPQDIKYKGEPTALEIGDNTVIREFVTVHRGTKGGGGITRIGENCLIMAYCHVAHDCQVGNNVIMVNGATLGGHVVIEDHVIMGGLSAVHQFCRIGSYAFLVGMSGTNKDIPPYVRYWGLRGKIYGLNLVGLRRHGFSRETIEALKKAYNIVFREAKTLTQGLDIAEKELGSVPEVKRFIQFIRDSKRGVPIHGDEDENIPA